MMGSGIIREAIQPIDYVVSVVKNQNMFAQKCDVVLHTDRFENYHKRT